MVEGVFCTCTCGRQGGFGAKHPICGARPFISQAHGLLSLFLLPRNLILKMVILILLCYHWLSRSVICSTEEVSTTVSGPWRAGLSMGLCKELVASSLLDIRRISSL